MLTVEQLAHRVRKQMYREVVDREGHDPALMTIGVAVTTVAREAGQGRAVTKLNRYVRANPFYHAPSLAEPINIVLLDRQRRAMAAEILAAGVSARIVKNCTARLVSVDRKMIYPEGFDSCVAAWIEEAAQHGIKVEHIGRPTGVYQDEAALASHACLVGTVRVVGSDQLLVITTTNYQGRHHVVQARTLNDHGGHEARCFRPVSA
ncbi:MAG TPA: hypothetical protein VFZ48_03860 [Candidatus Saccharimonadales bacterium]